jgi:hypothetical protein
MALFRAFSAYLRLGALIGFVVGDFLAVVALFRALSAFEDLRVPRFSSGIEESFVDKPHSTIAVVSEKDRA